MVTGKYIDDQIKRIKFASNLWNRPEINELQNIILPDEEIFECVNGWYQGGFALLIATNIRVLLIDKKPFKFLAVEDVRFDTITQIDYGHRFIDAHIGISTGMKDLTFRSYNKDRLRILIGHVQHRMAIIKAEQSNHSRDQKEHLKQIDSQLKEYLLAQYQQSNLLSEQPREQQLQVHKELNLQNGVAIPDNKIDSSILPEVVYKEGYSSSALSPSGVTTNQLYEDGIKEIYSKRDNLQDIEEVDNSIDINPLKIAYSKLPYILKSRAN